jgi:hypothetical protein
MVLKAGVELKVCQNESLDHTMIEPSVNLTNCSES